MSWLFSRALVEEYLEHTLSESERCVQLSGISTVDLFLLNDKMTESFHRSQYGMTYVHLMPPRGEELLTSYLGDSRVRVFLLPLEVGITQEIFGLKWFGCVKKYSRNMCLPKMSQQRPLNKPQAIAPKWATKPKCFPLARRTWVQTMFGKDIGYLHTPTTKANYSARSMQKWPVARNFTKVFGSPSPKNQEWMMGFPQGWTDTKPVEMDKFHLWQQRLCGCLHEINTEFTNPAHKGINQE